MDNPKQKLISYVVSINGPAKEHAELESAFKQGYSVVDMFSTPCGDSGGTSSNPGFVAVTVLLELETGSNAVHYRGGSK